MDTFVALLLFFATPCNSWNSSAYMNLMSPSRWTTEPGDTYIIKAGEIQEGYTNAQPSCLNRPVPPNVTRRLFPVSGGSLVFGFVNDTSSANPDPTDEKFWLDMYLTIDDQNEATYSDDFFHQVWLSGQENAALAGCPDRLYMFC